MWLQSVLGLMSPIQAGLAAFLPLSSRRLRGHVAAVGRFLHALGRPTLDRSAAG